MRPGTRWSPRREGGAAEADVCRGFKVAGPTLPDTPARIGPAAAAVTLVPAEALPRARETDPWKGCMDAVVVPARYRADRPGMPA